MTEPAREQIDESSVNVEHGPSFYYGFEVARRLHEPGFRDRLREAGKKGGCPLIPATYEEPFRAVTDRMSRYDEGLIVIADENEPEGVRLVWWEKR